MCVEWFNWINQWLALWIDHVGPPISIGWCVWLSFRESIFCTATHAMVDLRFSAVFISTKVWFLDRLIPSKIAGCFFWRNIKDSQPVIWRPSFLICPAIIFSCQKKEQKYIVYSFPTKQLQTCVDSRRFIFLFILEQFLKLVRHWYWLLQSHIIILLLQSYMIIIF